MSGAAALRLDQLEPASASARLLRFVGRYRYALLAAVALLHLLAFTGRWRPGGDSAAFLVLGRRLHEHGDLVTMTGYGDGVMPGYPWLLSQLIAITGSEESAITAAIGLNLAATLAWLTFVFLAVRAVVDRPTAVWVTLLCGVSARAMEAGADVLPGMVFAALLAAVLWAEAWRVGWWRWAIVAVLLVVMVALRSVTALVVGAAWLAWGIGMVRARVEQPPGDRSLASTAQRSVWAGLFVVFAFLFFVPGVRRDLEVLFTGLLSDGPGRVLGATREALVWAVPEGVIGIDPSVYVGPVLGVLFIGAGVALTRVRLFWGVLVLAFVLPWFLFLSTPRYVVPVLPLLLLGVWRLLVLMERRWPGARSGWAVLAAAGLLLAANGVGVGRLIVEQRGEPFLERYRDGKYAAAMEVSHWLRDNSLPGSRVLVTLDERPSVSWWSRRDALPLISTPAMNAGVLYAVEPLDKAARAAMTELGWSLGPALFEADDPRRGDTWTLHEVMRPTPSAEPTVGE